MFLTSFIFFIIFYSKCKITLTQSQLNGITNIIAGTISTTGNILSFNILNPAATIKKPPQALKSLIISGVVSGTINPADKNKNVKITNCGTAISETIYPRLQAKIAAVKKSRIDFVISRLGSPVIPSLRLPYIPIPLEQNSTITVINVAKNSVSDIEVLGLGRLLP